MPTCMHPRNTYTQPSLTGRTLEVAEGGRGGGCDRVSALSLRVVTSERLVVDFLSLSFLSHCLPAWTEGPAGTLRPARNELRLMASGKIVLGADVRERVVGTNTGVDGICRNPEAGAKSVPDGGRIGFRLPALSVVASDRERLVSRWFADLPIDGKGVLRISPILRKGRIRAFRREFFGAVVAAAARVVGSDAGVDGIAGTQRPARNRRLMVLESLALSSVLRTDTSRTEALSLLLEPHSRLPKNLNVTGERL